MSLLDHIPLLHPQPAPPPEVLLPWDGSLTVGNGLIDNEHHEIVRLLNLLWSNWRAKTHHLDMARTLATLERTLEMHFANEEEVMSRHRCPVLPGHHAAHTALLTELSDIHRSFRHGGGADAEGTLTRFLRKVVMEHVAEWDMECREYLRE